MKITPKTVEERTAELKRIDAEQRRRQPSQEKHAKKVEEQIEEQRNRASRMAPVRAKGARAAGAAKVGKVTRALELKRGKIISK